MALECVRSRQIKRFFRWRRVQRLCARHESRNALADGWREWNHALARRFRAAPNRPIWTSATVEASKLRLSCVRNSRCSREVEYVRSAIFCPSHHRHTLVSDLTIFTSARVGQTLPRSVIWTVGAIGGDAQKETFPIKIRCTARGTPATVLRLVHKSSTSGANISAIAATERRSSSSQGKTLNRIVLSRMHG